MQGSASAKSFLEKLKSGRAATAAIDNNTPPDSDGVIVRCVERRYASEPLSALGLKLTDDAEVLSTEPGSPAANANIVPHYMIVAVNNQFVGSRADFEEVAIHPLTLIIKLQSTGAMSELLANILDDEEKFNEHFETCIDTNELLRTTPRYGFLSAEHPMFLRWNQRLQTQREARQLIRQATREAEEQQAKEALELLRRIAESEEENGHHKPSLEDQHYQPAVQCPVLINPPAPDINAKGQKEVLLKQVQDESAFSTNRVSNEAPDELDEQASPEELLRLIGAEPIEPHAEQVEVIDNCSDVRFFIGPTEEYVLSNGLRVTVSVKQRSGPIPKPPPGKPPKCIERYMVDKSAVVLPEPVKRGNNNPCTFCYASGHTEKECVEKRNQDRKLSGAPKEREVCRDFLRGRCSRSDCMMRHPSVPRRGRRSRSRSRERTSRRSRDKRRNRSYRERHGSRRRSRRRDSSERSHRYR